VRRTSREGGVRSRRTSALRDHRDRRAPRGATSRQRRVRP
jgi:hypothetical protein